MHEGGRNGPRCNQAITAIACPTISLCTLVDAHRTTTVCERYLLAGATGLVRIEK